MEVITADKNSVNRLANILAEAMYNDPMYYYIFNEKESSYRYFSVFWKAILEYTMKFGIVLTTEDLLGAACLLPPNKTDFTFNNLLMTGFRVPLSILRFPISKMIDTMDILFSLGDYQNQVLSEPHWYLMEIGVKPENQGNGIGGSLLRKLIEMANNNKTPIYLETETEKNVQLYQKYGFSIVKDINLKKHNLRYYLMVRNAL